MLQLAFALLWAAAIAGLLVAAALKGGAPEKAAATFATAAWIGSLLIVQVSQIWHGPNPGLFLIDVAFLGSLFAVSFMTRRFWPLVASGFQLCGVCLHFAYLVQPTRMTAAYYVALQITSCAVLLAICNGIIQSWQDSSNKSI